MMKFFNWLFRRKSKPTPEQKAGLVAVWKKVPEEALEDLPRLYPRFPTYVWFSDNFGEQWDKIEVDWNKVIEAVAGHKEPDPDIETDKKY